LKPNSTSSLRVLSHPREYPFGFGTLVFRQTETVVQLEHVFGSREAVQFGDLGECEAGECEARDYEARDYDPGKERQMQLRVRRGI